MCGQAQDLASIVIPIVSLSCLIVFAYNVSFCWGNLTSFWRINLLLLFDPEIHPLKTWRCEMKGFLSGSVGHCEQNWKLWLFWQDGNHTAFHRALDKMWVTDRNQTSSVRMQTLSLKSGQASSDDFCPHSPYKECYHCIKSAWLGLCFCRPRWIPKKRANTSQHTGGVKLCRCVFFRGRIEMHSRILLGDRSECARRITLVTG